MDKEQQNSELKSGEEVFIRATVIGSRYGDDMYKYVVEVDHVVSDECGMDQLCPNVDAIITSEQVKQELAGKIKYLILCKDTGYAAVAYTGDWDSQRDIRQYKVVSTPEAAGFTIRSWKEFYAHFAKDKAL